MAVYTQLGTAQLKHALSHYHVGELVSAKGIAEGVSNSNWLIETYRPDSGNARYILTMYERRIDPQDLPFFLALLDHLSARDCPVPRTMHRNDGALFGQIDGKAVALIEFLPGVSPDQPNEVQAVAIGRALAHIHEAASDFPHSRTNPLGPENWYEMLARCGQSLLAAIDPALPGMIMEADRLRRDWPRFLPRSVIHTDLFPDNALYLGNEVSGLIDFYFACTDSMAYDLAVTHAAWSFDSKDKFQAKIGTAIVDGYESVRRLEEQERAALPLLAKSACMRFIASRAADWLEMGETALVARKDPLQFVRRFTFYRDRADDAFSN